MTPPPDGTGGDAARTQARRHELAANLEQVRERLAHACARAGRDPGELDLIAVTKTFPVIDVRLLAELGVGDVGENRAGEAIDKAAECVDLDLRWHFLGQLQTNKAASIARHVDVVHSVDRPRLVDTLSRALTTPTGTTGTTAAEDASVEYADVGRSLRCLVQVRLDDRPTRGGVDVAHAAELADHVAAAPGLQLGGLMAVAPLGGDAGAAFKRLAEVARAIRRNHPEADWISAGMTEDLEPAVEHGATHVRIGRALLGERPSLR